MKTLSLLAALVLTSPVAFAQPKDDKFPVKVEFEVSKPAEGRQTVTVTLKIEKGYHVTANPPGQDELKSVQTTLTVSGTGEARPKEVKITYPIGEVVKNEIIGDYRIYTGTVTLKAEFGRTDEPDPILVTVRLRPFDHAGCRWGFRTFTHEVR